MARKSRFRDRKDYGKELQERTEAASGARGGKWKPIFRTDIKFERWQCKEADHVIDIIPYIDNDGKIRYKLEVLVHQRIGPDEGNYICPKTFDSRADCRLCDARATAQANGNEDLADSLRPRDRVIYNIVCYDSDKEEDKGVQIWEASSYLAEENFQAAAKQRKKGGTSRKVSFSNPDDGRTISFERTGTGKKTKYVGFTMDVRDEPISDEILDEAYVLEDLIDIPTAKVLQELADIVLSTTDREESTQENEEKEEPPSRPRRRSRMSQRAADTEPGPEESEESEESEEEAEPKRNARSARRRPAARRRPTARSKNEDYDDYDEDDVPF